MPQGSGSLPQCHGYVSEVNISHFCRSPGKYLLRIAHISCISSICGYTQPVFFHSTIPWGCPSQPGGMFQPISECRICIHDYYRSAPVADLISSASQEGVAFCESQVAHIIYTRTLVVNLGCRMLTHSRGASETLTQPVSDKISTGIKGDGDDREASPSPRRCCSRLLSPSSDHCSFSL